MDAKTLIEEIRREKKKAVASGILRDEKPLPQIADTEKPHTLPEGWLWCRLGDYALKVTDYVASGSFASLKENVLITNEDNYAVMVKTADFANGFTKNLTYTDEHGYKFLENSNLYGGELILSNIGSIGKVFIVPDLHRPMTLASNTIMIRMTHNEYNKYLYYLFLSPFGQKLLISISSGTSMLKFNKTQLKSSVIPVAPLELQFQICNTLDRVQKIISARKAELAKLDDLIKARFVEMFGDPVSNPKGWVKKALSEEAEIRIGPFGSLLHKDDYVSGGHALVNPSHIIDGQIVPDNELTISDTKYTELSPYHLIPGDVVMGRRGEMGRCAVVEESGLLCGTGSLLIRTHGDLSADFIQKIISFPSFKRTIEDMAVGQTMPNLNVPIVSSFEIIKPPKSVQERYYAFVAQIDKSKSAIQKSLDETKTLFDSLMQKYFG